MIISLSFTDAAGSGTSSIAISGFVAEMSGEFAAPKVVSAPPPTVGGNEGDQVRTSHRVTIERVETWSHSKEGTFSRLAAAKALGKASSSQLTELERLRAIRRRMKNPMSADEVIFQYRRREMESRLLADLQRYVEFLEAPRRA